MNTTLTQLRSTLTDLARVADGIGDEQENLPTPCENFDVAQLRNHVVGWLENFADGYAGPDGVCPNPDVGSVVVPAADAADRIDTAREKLSHAIDDGAADRDLIIAGDGLPGGMALSMILSEYIIHGWDLAVATGQEWDPDAEAAAVSREFLTGMVPPDSRGPDGMFGPEVEVPADVDALERLLAFSGRDPRWSA